MFFGKVLKEARKNEAKMGPRKFSIAIGMKPVAYSHIEHGYDPPPRDVKFLEKLKKYVPKHYPLLLQEIRKPFIMQKKDEDIVPIVFKSIGKEKFDDLCNYIKQLAEEHNKKADQYNANQLQNKDEAEC
jgi:hypothetical protein